MEISNQTRVTRLISRDDKKLNFEMPFSELADWETPNEQFYLRSHFPVPSFDLPAWRLKVEGAVGRSLELSLAKLQQLPVRTITATMECAGNGRSFIEPNVTGVPWGLGAVGNARWTGVLLADVLRLAAPQSENGHVSLEGADRGDVSAKGGPAGEIQYARSVPLPKANDDVLLAWAMNDQPLSAEHGAPLRAVVPGWFGMASVKWLQRIIVNEAPFFGYFESIDYAYWERGRDGSPALAPLTSMRAKAQIARPAMHETVPANSEYVIHGAAWTGGVAEITAVEVSTNGGETWTAAELLGPSVKNAWRFWQFSWRTPAAPGTYTLIARATDSAGKTQPSVRNPDYQTYMIDHCLRIAVEVR